MLNPNMNFGYKYVLINNTLCKNKPYTLFLKNLHFLIILFHLNFIYFPAGLRSIWKVQAEPWLGTLLICNLLQM